MALTSKSSKNRVPVKNRRSNVKVSSANFPNLKNARVGTVELIVLAVVFIVLLLSIALPLRNYFEQRNEIKEVNQAIAQKQQRKEELLGELDRYKNKAYLNEQARNRLGVIAPGEVPFRILDPGMSKEDSLTTKSTETTQEPQAWYDTMWGAVVSPVQEVEETPQTPEMKLPVEPAPPQP
ncbi:FtsB family cell division protein [Corynebacterium sp. H130]|uniref:FtsB family cell division protein n=1 Tax=Corynebacterium sp. H130 TaxID=3133444 RepID=UPI0030ACA5C0